ncbi:anti-sigma factor [uncultured Brachyspira sp.]|uniref:anti-sigma factor family protein n=1 Tax=uncultured Brachyspira sp. TaxID=221953 RepID=UPI0026070928|nr:anti-sigma factor [uncultured Brachyspira sp.]
MERNMKQECVDIKPLLYAYIDNELAGEQSSIVTSHISECESCKARLASMYRVRDMVKSVYAPKEDIDLSKKIMANIKFNNKYGKIQTTKIKENIEEKTVHINNNAKQSLPKIVAGKVLYIAVAAAAIVFAIGATVTYFEKSNPVSVEMANQTYNNFEDYVLEHYTNSYAGPSAQASVISVNFEK